MSTSCISAPCCGRRAWRSTVGRWRQARGTGGLKAGRLVVSAARPRGRLSPPALEQWQTRRAAARLPRDPARWDRSFLNAGRLAAACLRRRAPDCMWKLALIAAAEIAALPTRRVSASPSSAARRPYRASPSSRARTNDSHVRTRGSIVVPRSGTAIASSTRPASRYTVPRGGFGQPPLAPATTRSSSTMPLRAFEGRAAPGPGSCGPARTSRRAAIPGAQARRTLRVSELALSSPSTGSNCGSPVRSATGPSRSLSPAPARPISRHNCARSIRAGTSSDLRARA